MGNRILKESICMSDTIDQLSWFEEVFFYRLLVNADDFGRFDGRLHIIKAKLFPLKNISDKDIVDALLSLEQHGLLATYGRDNRQVIQIITWDHHQSVRNKKSKYPAINGDVSISAMQNIEMIRASRQNNSVVEINCNQLHAIACNCDQLHADDFKVSNKESSPLTPPLFPPLDNPPLTPPYNPPSKKGDHIAREATQASAIETQKKSQKPVVSDEEAKNLVDRFTKNDEYAKSMMVFVGHRRDIKKPMTPLALEQMLKLLDKKLDTDQERVDCLELSIANGWQGVFPNKIQMQKNGIRDRPSQRTLNRYGTEPGGLGVKDYMGGDDDEQ